MRLTVRLRSPQVSLLLQRKAAPFKEARATLQNRPLRRVEKIVIKASAQHPALQERAVESFSQLHVRKDVVTALKNIGVTTPTVIQMLAIPKILHGRNILCAAETGSGKTLAYLVPLISRMRDEEEHGGMVPRLRRPRTLVLLPSRDLAKQVLSVAKSLCHDARFRAVGFIGGIQRKYIKEALMKPVDIAIATPDSLLRFKREEQILLTDLSHLVIDEADTLFDHSFEAATTSIMQSIKVRSKNPPPPPALGEDTQVTIVGATLSTRMLKTIEKLVPNIKKVSSKNLHQILPNIHQTFYRVRQDKKAEKLLSLLQANPHDVVLVFCNTVSSCDWTAHFLQDQGIPVVKLHAGFSPMDRKNLLKEFKDGKARVMVCTDIASRGIDFIQVTHVVLFDFPTMIADYLHRVGRTGRVGSVAHCKATAFMAHRRDIRMVWKIKDAADKRAAIMNIKISRQLQRLEQAATG